MIQGGVENCISSQHLVLYRSETVILSNELRSVPYFLSGQSAAQEKEPSRPGTGLVKWGKPLCEGIQKAQGAAPRHGRRQTV